MPGPLAGVRVLDLTGVVSGPFATMFLADQGADVIKIEPISGDITRRSRAPIDKGGEFSALFISSNRGKRSLAIDIKSKAGVEVLKKLVGQADVLVQNFRPGTMERLGLGPDELLAQQPRLIYVSISGVGETGPYARKRVYDPIVQGLSGFADIQAQPVTNRPQMIRTIVADKTTAIVTAQAVSSALYAREKTGRGDHIRVAMLDAMLSYLWPEGMSQYTVIDDDGKAPDPNDRPDLVFKTQDGYITCGTISDSEWQGFCRATGDPALAADERFATPAKRVGQCDGANTQDAGIHRPAHDGGVAGASGRGGRALRADPAPQRDHQQRTGGRAADHRGTRSAFRRAYSAAQARRALPDQCRAHRRTGAAHRRALQADTPRSRLRGRRTSTR